MRSGTRCKRLSARLCSCVILLLSFLPQSGLKAQATDTSVRVFGNTTIRWAPSATYDALYVEVRLSNQLVGLANLTPVAPAYQMKFYSGNDSISGLLNTQFSTGPQGQPNLLIGNFTWYSLTQNGFFNAVIGTWNSPATGNK